MTHGKTVEKRGFPEWSEWLSDVLSARNFRTTWATRDVLGRTDVSEAWQLFMLNAEYHEMQYSLLPLPLTQTLFPDTNSK